MRELTAKANGIYEILNTETGQWYRGQAWAMTIAKRWYYHKRRLRNGKHSNHHLQSAWDKYGEEAFVFTVFEHCDTLEACNEREVWWIGDDYNRRDVSYNKRAGGDATGELSDETKRKMSASRTGTKNHQWGKPLTKEAKAKLSAANKGKKLSEATKAKMSEAHKGAKNHMYKPFQVRFPDGRVKRWETTRKAAAAYGVSPGSIMNFLYGMRTPGNHKSSAHLKGTIWQYV